MSRKTAPRPTFGENHFICTYIYLGKTTCETFSAFQSTRPTR